MGYPDFQSYQALATLISAALQSAGIPVVSNPVQMYGGAHVPAGAALVGATVNKATYAGDTPVTAAQQFNGYVGRPAALNVQKVYYSEGGWPGTIPDPGNTLAQNGVSLLISFKPSRTLSVSEKNNLSAALQMYINAGYSIKAILWQEPFAAFPTPANYVAYAQYYAPTIQAKGIKIVWDIDGSNESKQAAYYPGDAYVDEIAVDYYCGAWANGQTLATAQALADNAVPPKPFGLCEWGASASANFTPTAQQWASYITYLTGLFKARINGGKTNAWICQFASYDPAKPQDFPINAVFAANDFKVPGIQSMYDQLSPLPTASFVIPAGGSLTVPPLNATPGGGYARCAGLGYEFNLSLSCDAASLNPFAEMVLSFYTADVAGIPAIETVRGVMAASHDAGGGIITGTGPGRGGFATAVINNLDTVKPMTVQLTMASTSRNYRSDDWHEVTNYSVPGFTRPSQAAGTKYLGAFFGQNINAGTHYDVLFPMHAGQIWLDILQSGVNAPNMFVSAQPMPVSYFGSADVLDDFPGGAGLAERIFFASPRCPLRLRFANNGSAASSASAAMVAAD